MTFVPEPCAPGGASGSDVESTLLCDIDANGNVVGTALAVYTYDENGVPQGAPTFVDPATGDPYVAQGTLQPCGESVDTEAFILCEEIEGSGVVQKFIRHFVYNEGNLSRTYDTLLNGLPYTPTGTVVDCEPETLCVIDDPGDLNGACGPGEAPNEAVIVADGQSSNAEVVNDATADPLCGGQWNRAGEPAPAPFPVDEPFRSGTYNDGSVTEFGAAHQTSGNEDPAGQGWLRLNGNVAFENGGIVFNTPFPSSEGVNIEFDFASYGGTDPGGDGWFFFLADAAAPAQGPMGGGGTIGLANVEGGYLAVGFDEYGSFTSFGSAPNIFIHDLTNPATVGGTAGTIAFAPAAPNNPAQQPRDGTPPRVRLSVVNDGGQVFVTVSIDWNRDGTFTEYPALTRVNVTGSAGIPPAQFRMGFNGASGGALQSLHEVRDLVAQAGEKQSWRAFPVTADATPACATGLTLVASVDVTVNQDTQAAGNNDNEAWFWLVDTTTGTIVARDEFSSQPGQVGQTRTLTVTENIPVGSLGNYRLYVGQNTRDSAGVYSMVWEDLSVTVAATGCPGEEIRTIPVRIVCSDVDFGGGGGSEPVVVNNSFNAPSTFEDALICYWTDGDPERRPGFRREVRTAEGTTTITFIGEDGIPINDPTTHWVPGPCPTNDTVDDECVQDDNGIFFRRTTVDEDGTIVVETVDVAGNPYVPVGVVRACEVREFGQEISETVWCLDGVQYVRQISVYESSPPGSPGSSTDPVISWRDLLGNIAPDFTDAELLAMTEGACPADAADPECCPTVLAEGCWDDGANTGRWISIRESDGTTSLIDPETGDPVASTDVVDCPSTQRLEAFVELCSDEGPFIRKFIQDADGNIVATRDITYTGAAAGTRNNIRKCEAEDSAEQVNARMFDLTPTSAPPAWTPAFGGAPGVISVTMTVLAGTARVTDNSGNVTDNLPVGYTATWSKGEIANTLNGPTLIQANAPDGRVIINWVNQT